MGFYVSCGVYINFAILFKIRCVYTLLLQLLDFCGYNPPANPQVCLLQALLWAPVFIN